MKKISIKLKIILWFCGFMLILLSAMYIFFFFFGNHLINSDNQGRLTNMVDEYAVNIASKDPNAENRNIDNKAFHKESETGRQEKKEHNEFYNGYEGIYIAVYKEDGELIKGTLPDEFADTAVDFDDKEMQSKEISASTWYVYDRKIEQKEGGCLWVRGVSLSTHSENSIQIIFLLLAAGFPILVLLAAFGGYYMLKKAFLPVNAIMRTAEEIGDGRDLKRRIQLGDGNDEIHKLANTFDHMFERLEAFFENEKRFTSDASHELRTPVSSIIAQCEYAIENAETLDEAKISLEKILDQSQKMSMLISELLLLARADKGTQKLNIEKVNISELTEIICEQQSEIAIEKNIQIHTDIQKNISMDADETMLMRMLINLIENGICYGKEHGNVTVILKEEKERICFEIRDDGIGIKEESLSRIWERFYQVDPSRNAAKGNSGLGLSMVAWIVKAHGGEVFVKSQYGFGTEFFVSLPKTQIV